MPKKITLQLAFFLIVGGLAFLLDLATFAALSSARFDLVFANFASISLSTLAAFFGHLLITFDRRGADKFVYTSAKFLAVAVFFGLINFGLSTSLILLISNSLVGELAVKAGVILALAILRFAMMKWWVFS